MDEFWRQMKAMEEVRRSLVDPMRLAQEYSDLIGQSARAQVDQLIENTKVIEASMATLQLPETASVLSSAIVAQQSVADAWKVALAPNEEVSAGVAAFLDAVSGYSSAAETAFMSLRLDEIGIALRGAAEGREQLLSLTLQLDDVYASVASSVALAGPATFPPFVTSLPSTDVFVHNEAVRTITPHDEYPPSDADRSNRLLVRVSSDTDAYLDLTLPRLKPAFLLQLRGFVIRGQEGGPDWWTQGAASGRKLLLGVLHSVAPDDTVLDWLRKMNVKGGVDNAGHPKRSAKVAWLCSSIENEHYRKFVQTDLESALSLVGVFDAGVHADEFPDFESAYSWTVLRVKVAIGHILRIWEARRRPD